MEKEFKIGDVVTLDRYNHIDDMHAVEIVGFVTVHKNLRKTMKIYKNLCK